jgi:hypothetical protein
MKFSTLVIASALAVGGTAALAQTDNSSSSSGTHNGPSLVDKAKSGIHRLGNATRNALHKVGGKNRHDTQASSNDTSAMGASSSQDSARRARMDDAYSRYQAGQQKR